MQPRLLFTQRNTAFALCLVLLLLAQQACTGPLAPQIQPGNDGHVGTLRRRVGRMTPLWRIMNSKPFGAYCQGNYECTTGLCRAGHCSTSHRSPAETVTY